MRKIVLFNQTDNLYQYINKFAHSSKKTLVVTPSPNYSDMLRSNLVGHNADFQVITIAKFIRDELKALFDDEILQNFKGKSELLMELSSVFKRMFPDEGYAFFEQSFTLLTDFRSFSLNSDVLESILDQYPSKMHKAVLGMHNVLESLGYFDEHKSYFTLSERLRAGDLPIEYDENREIIFYGFDFLAPSQVDLLKSFSIRSDVFIPVYENVYSKKSHLDWIEWLECDEVESIDKAQNVENLSIKSYPKNYLSKVLNEVVSQNESDLQVLLSTKKLSLESIVMTSVDSMSFKIPMEFMLEDVEAVYQDLSLNISKYDFSEKIIEMSSLALMDENFKRYKVLSLFNDTYKEWSAIKADDDVYGEYHLKIFKEVVLLDLPRVSAIGKNNNAKIKLVDFQNIESINKEVPLLFCFASDFSNFSSSVTPYLEGVEKYLSTIGPIRNSELEKQVLLAKVKNSLQHKNLQVFIEEGLIEEDVDIASLFHFEENDENKFNVENEKKTLYPEYNEVENFEFVPSATNLQTYIDCPRQFRLKYIEGLSSIISYPEKLNKLELGRIEHAIIEKFIKNNDRYDYDELMSMIYYEIKKEFGSKEISQTTLNEILVEVESLTSPIIQKLFSLIHTGKFKIDFEISLTDRDVRGSIDCVLHSDEEIFLSDFKRGEFSIPSKKDFENFEKIQIWFYLNHYANLNDTPMTFGYINLSQNEKSLLFSTYDNTSLLAELLEVKQYQVDEFKSVMKEYQQFESSLITSIKEEKVFPARARKSQLCDFCSFNQYCEKVEVVHE